MKKLLSVLLAVAMLLAVAIPAMAAATVTTPANDGLVDGVVDFDDLLGAQEPSTPEVEDVTISSAPSTVEYTVEGQTVTIDHAVACKVGYLDGDEYVAVAATANGDGTYSFVVPENVTDVIIVVKGDISGDGDISLADSTKTKAVFNNKTTVSAEALFAADATGDGSITLADSTRIKAVFNNKTTLAW